MTLGTQWSWKPDDTLKTLKQCVHVLVIRRAGWQPGAKHGSDAGRADRAAAGGAVARTGAMVGQVW